MPLMEFNLLFITSILPPLLLCLVVWAALVMAIGLDDETSAAVKGLTGRRRRYSSVRPAASLPPVNPSDSRGRAPS